MNNCIAEAIIQQIQTTSNSLIHRIECKYWSLIFEKCAWLFVVCVHCVEQSVELEFCITLETVVCVSVVVYN